MTKNYIVKELINEMKERIPQGQNLANYLTDTLYMGKEAVYRRLRGEVAFTFDEIASTFVLYVLSLYHPAKSYPSLLGVSSVICCP